MQHRHTGAGQVFELLQHPLTRAHQLEALFGCADLQKLVDVGAGNEAIGLGRPDDDSVQVLFDDVVELGSQIAQHGGG